MLRLWGLDSLSCSWVAESKGQRKENDRSLHPEKKTTMLLKKKEEEEEDDDREIPAWMGWTRAILTRPASAGMVSWVKISRPVFPGLLVAKSPVRRRCARRGDRTAASDRR
jgi:hypothetical protein